MTVAELIAELLALPQDALVVCQKDAEGNGYSPLDCAEAAWYAAESTWSGEVYADEDQPDDEDTGEEFDRPSDAVRCVVLAPIN